MHVMDHVKGQPTSEKRNVLVESARIARGNIKDLAKLDVKGLDALIIPGRKRLGQSGVTQKQKAWSAWRFLFSESLTARFQWGWMSPGARIKRQVKTCQRVAPEFRK